jgi:hypothetical protein
LLVRILFGGACFLKFHKKNQWHSRNILVWGFHSQYSTSLPWAKSHANKEQTRQWLLNTGQIKLDSRNSPTMHMNPFYSSTEIFHKKNQWHSRKTCMPP